MKVRIGPVRQPFDILMLERVAMDVVEVTLVIPFIADQMFPVAPLPDAALASVLLIGGASLGDWQAFGEGEFDDLPAQGKVGIAWR